jgi:hypothetical protein
MLTCADICSTALGACHQGAAIEGLCPTGEKIADPASSYTTFYHYVSSGSQETAGAPNTPGGLSWTLHAGNMEVPSAMSLSFITGSNLANPTFFPGNETYTPVGFKDCGNMYIPQYQDDTVSPPVYYTPSLQLENWYVCLTRWSYLYSTLSWKIGVKGDPQNPSCQKVEVTRVFV